MEQPDRREIESHLREWIDKLSTQLPSLREAAKPVAPDNALGRITRMDAIQSTEIHRNAYQQAQNQLANLNRALSRIDDPDFGLCTECDEPIPLARLKAVPGAMVCVRCA